MNAVWNSYGQLCGCPEIFKKSCKFFCRELDIQVAQIVKADMRHIQIFKQLSELGRYPRRRDRGTVRLRYNKVIVIVRLSVLFCLFALRFLHSKLFEEKRAGKLCDRQLSPVGFWRCHFLNDFCFRWHLKG